MAKKFLIASDLHGSMIALDKALMRFNETKADKLLLLGDIFGANADEMVAKLNQIADKLVVIRGNCDSYFESKDAKFEIFDNNYENINGSLAYLCHGHKLNDMDLAGYGAKLIVFGHIHRPMLRISQGVILLCPGSLASPRDGAEKCYAIIDETNLIQIFNDSDELVDEMRI